MKARSVQQDATWLERIGKEERCLGLAPRPNPFQRNPLGHIITESPAPGSTAASSCSGMSKNSLSAPHRFQKPAAADDDLGSQLSVQRSQISQVSRGSMPSTIRSSEPSAIARNKIAELQLRLELERVVRLERENELENQRRVALERAASAADDASRISSRAA